MTKVNKNQRIFWIIWLAGIIIAAILLSIFATGCQRQAIPQIIYKEKIDTISFSKIDTIINIDDCEEIAEDFNQLLYNFNKQKSNISILENEIIELSKIDKSKNVKTKIITKNSNNTTEINKLNRSIQIKDSQIDSLNLALKSIQKAKDNSAIGNENQLKKTTKKNNWWWIFLAGFLSAQLVNIGIKILIKKSGILNIWNMTN
jgi:predicted RNase H-like nuclease (RuvC/YqgF family)